MHHSASMNDVCVLLFLYQMSTWNINPLSAETPSLTLSAWLLIWCPNSLCHQVFSNHDIDDAGWAWPCLQQRKISTACASSRSGIDKQHKHIFMFPNYIHQHKGEYFIYTGELTFLCVKPTIDCIIITRCWPWGNPWVGNVKTLFINFQLGTFLP